MDFLPFQALLLLSVTAFIGCKRLDSSNLNDSEIKVISDGMDLDLQASIEEIELNMDDSYLDLIPSSTSNNLSQSFPVKNASPAAKENSNNLSEFQLTGKAEKRKNELDRAKKFILDLKKSLSQVGRSTCKLIEPYFRGPQQTLMHPYFFAGYEGNAGAGIIVLSGKEFVWDLYNMQFSAFNYQGFGFTAGSSSIGAEIAGYFGVGFGQKPDVISAWSGKFQSAGISGSLPILADYLSAGASGFTGLSPSGQPDYSIYGASLGGSLSFSVPTAIPISGSVKQATWKHSLKDNMSLSAFMKKAGIKLSITGRETCNEQCVRFDSADAKASYRARAQTLIRSIPILANIRENAQYFPGFNNVALLALATGVYRDTANAAEACKKRKKG